MAARQDHRTRIISTAAALFRRQGYTATGMAEIIAASGAPTGSVYHYFPGGKAQIGAHAVAFAGELVRNTLEELATTASGPADAIQRYTTLLAQWMEQSQWTSGCPRRHRPSRNNTRGREHHPRRRDRLRRLEERVRNQPDPSRRRTPPRRQPGEFRDRRRRRRPHPVPRIAQQHPTHPSRPGTCSSLHRHGSSGFVIYI